MNTHSSTNTTDPSGRMRVVSPDGTEVVFTPANSMSNSLVKTARAISQGELPSNKLINSTLHATSDALEEAKKNNSLDEKGQLLVEDTRDVLDSAVHMIQAKNQDQKLQRLIGNTMELYRDESVEDSAVPRDLLMVRNQTLEAFSSAREIAVLAIRSEQFREILLEMLDFVQTAIRSSNDKAPAVPTLGPQMPPSGVNAEEYKRSLMLKLRVLLVHLGSKPQYYKAIDHLIAIVDQMEERTNLLRYQGDQLPSKKRFEGMWQDARHLVEEFSGREATQNFLDRTWSLFHMLREDPEAKAYLQEVRLYVSEIARDPTRLDDSRMETGGKLVDRGNALVQVKYRQPVQDVLDAATTMLVNIRNDTTRQDFATKLQKLGADLACDELGRPDIFVLQHSLSQMKAILVPVLTEQFRELPVPRIEGSNHKYDFAIDKMTLRMNELLPDSIDFKTKSDSTLTVKSLDAQTNNTKIIMKIEHIRAVFRDIRFFYRRKKIPKMRDEGIVDVDLSQGNGVSIKVVWKLSNNVHEGLHVKLYKVWCNVSKLSINIRDARHSILDKLVTQLFAGTIKKQVAGAVVNSLVSAVEPFNARLNEVFRTRPLLATMHKANDSVKSAFFDSLDEKSDKSEKTDKSLFQKAAEVVTGAEANTSPKDKEAAQKAADGSQPVYHTADAVNSSMTPAPVTPRSSSEQQRRKAQPQPEISTLQTSQSSEHVIKDETSDQSAAPPITNSGGTDVVQATSTAPIADHKADRFAWYSAHASEPYVPK